MTPVEARALFPVLEQCAYLNAGSVGPLSSRTYDAMQSGMREALQVGRGGAAIWEKAFANEAALRQRIAAFINAPDDRVVLTSSTTEGCNIVVTGLRLGVDDEVVTTNAEHPGLLMPLLASGARVKQADVMSRPAAEATQAVLAEVTPRTKLVALSHVLWVNGHVLPLADIKRETGLPLLVDGAQSVGAIPVDASVADWYTVSGQKWLCGPETTGALYVKDHERLRPQMQAYAASSHTDTGRLALVHLSPLVVSGLLTALEDIPDWGFTQTAKMVARCRAALLACGAEVRTEPNQGTLISFRVPGDPVELVKAAGDRQIVIRSLPDGWLRASVGWWTDDSDIERLVEYLVDQKAA
jgi:L-cysteine/cystine lyase